MPNQLSAVTGRSQNLKYADIIQGQVPVARANYYAGLERKQQQEQLDLEKRANRASKNQAAVSNSVSGAGLGYVIGSKLGATTGGAAGTAIGAGAGTAAGAGTTAAASGLAGTAAGAGAGAAGGTAAGTGLGAAGGAQAGSWAGPVGAGIGALIGWGASKLSDSHICGAIKKYVGLSRKETVMLARMLRHAETNHSDDTRKYKIIGRDLIARMINKIKDLRSFMADLKTAIIYPVVLAVESGDVELGFAKYKDECMKLFNEFAPDLLEA